MLRVTFRTCQRERLPTRQNGLRLGVRRSLTERITEAENATAAYGDKGLLSDSWRFTPGKFAQRAGGLSGIGAREKERVRNTSCKNRVRPRSCGTSTFREFSKRQNELDYTTGKQSVMTCGSFLSWSS